MQKTRPLGSLKGIFPPIHQPLPLNKHESQRLLDAIKTSFRRQLDLEHARIAPGSARPSLTKQRLTYLPSSAAPSSSALSALSAPSAPSAPSAHGSLARPTDRHMHAILKNPLFSPVQMAKPDQGSGTPELDKHKAIFQTAVSRGLMNLTRAHGFLMLVKAVVDKSSTVSVLEGLKPTGAGLLVLQWLRSSGEEHGLLFLHNKQFRGIFIKFLIAEDLDDVVWTWFERLLYLSAKQPKPDDNTVAKLLRDFVHSKSLAPELEGAYTAILKAEAMVKEKQLSLEVLRDAWSQLAFQSTMNAHSSKSPPVDLFDRFVALGVTIGSRPLELAHVNLHHPVDPSSDLAVEYLSSETTWASMRSQIEQRISRPQFLDRLWSLGLDTVQHLMRANETQQASRMWDLLATHLGSSARPEPKLF